MHKRKTEELKNSGTEWLGDIPKGWRVKKLKFVSVPQTSNVDKKTKEGQVSVELCNYTDVYYNDFITNDIEFMKASATADQLEKFKLERGDVILTKDSESPDDIAVPALVKETKENLICGYHLAQIKPKSQHVSGDFLFRLLQSGLYSEEFGNRSNGITRYGLGAFELRNIDVLLPPKSEQKAIASFLDRKTQSIDQLIEKKQQLIEKLKEKRQALITRAVTKGLNPDVPMKDSEIEWLGQIPKHWEVEKNKHLFKEIDRRSETGKEELLSVSHKTGVTRRSEKDVNMFKAESNIGYKICEVDDLVINTMWAWMGALGISQIRGIVSPSYNVYRLKSPKMIHKYFDLYIKSPGFIVDVNRFSKGVWSSRLRLYPDEFFMIKTPIPPIEEQMEIVEVVHNAFGEFERIEKKVESQIEKLKEYRQSLISAAVTGKIDVRDEVDTLAE